MCLDCCKLLKSYLQNICFSKMSSDLDEKTTNLPENSEKLANNWRNLYEVNITENTKIVGHKKCIVLKQLELDGDEQPFLLADIRAYLNGKPTKCGVSLTPYEFDWLARRLLYLDHRDQTLKGKDSPRTLSIKHKAKKSRGIQLEQQVNDQIRKINLYPKEISRIVNNYGHFYSIIEEMEEYESEPQDVVG
jgi:hypothetical protein